MAKQTINLGTTGASGTDGDTIRNAWTKANANFSELMDSQAAGYVWITPSGAAGAPVFRRLVAADLPATYVDTTSAQTISGAKTFSSTLTISNGDLTLNRTSGTDGTNINLANTADGTLSSADTYSQYLRFLGYYQNGTLYQPLRLNWQSGTVETTIVRPQSDNAYTCGASGYRWSVVWAGTSTISTSDGREKDVDQTTMKVNQLTDNEMACGLALGKEIGWYKFLAAIAEKGDAARKHIGMTVQRAMQIMESFGLDPFEWSFICYDEWDAVEKVVEDFPPILDEDGNVIRQAMAGVVTTEGRAAGNRYSFRESGLHAFIMRAYIQKQEQLEARISALENAA